MYEFNKNLHWFYSIFTKKLSMTKEVERKSADADPCISHNFGVISRNIP
jgi:hypothetical protein